MGASASVMLMRLCVLCLKKNLDAFLPGQGGAVEDENATRYKRFSQRHGLCHKPADDLLSEQTGVFTCVIFFESVCNCSFKV